MFPEQQNQNGGQPQAGPQLSYQPPAAGVNSVPQQTAGGQYQVVVPPSVTGRPTGHNPYEFIVSPNTSKHRGSLFGGNSFLKQIVLLVGGSAVLMIIIAVAVSLLAPKGSTGNLTAIAERQQEIIRVATAASSQVASQDTKNFVASTELAVTSSQSQVLAYLSVHGGKPSDKQLALDQDAQTDTQLTNAQATNTYDSAAKQILTTQLNTYAGLLQTAYKQTSSAQVKQLLQQSYSAAALLVEQAKQ
jgi:hypothetical protein